MGDQLPAATGRRLIRLLKCDGWTVVRRNTHGYSLTKFLDGRKRVRPIVLHTIWTAPEERLRSRKTLGGARRKRLMVVAEKRSPCATGSLHDILGHKQTCLEHEWI